MKTSHLLIAIVGGATVGGIAAAILTAGSQPTALSAESRHFFEQNCIKCHGAEKQKADLRLDTLKWNPEDPDNLALWQEIADRVDSGDMPPEGEPRPDAKQLRTVTTSIARRLASVAIDHESNRVVLRRLNRAQYRNTLRDLLHIKVEPDDPTEGFPIDDKVAGFDNIGEALQMSDYLLSQYLLVAREAVDRATFEGARPQSKEFSLKSGKRARAQNFNAGGHPKGLGRVVLFRNDEWAPGDPRGQKLGNSRDGAERDGWYDFAYHVTSQGRGNLAQRLQYDGKLMNELQVYRPEDKHRFELYVVGPDAEAPNQLRRRILVAGIDMPDNQPQIIKRRLWLPKAWRVEAAFGNGYGGNARTLLGRLDRNADTKATGAERKGSIIPLLEKADGPRLTISAVTETGPHYEQWPPKSHQTVYGRPGQSPAEIIRTFATRAFRRPVTDEDIAPYLHLAKTSPEGIRTAIEGILCSPRFLYLTEQPGELDDHAIASRLSYFLWNTMPDETLRQAAAKGGLQELDKLQSQLDRLLADPRSEEFAKTFVWSWLGLESTVDSPPDPVKYYEYYQSRLNEAMVTETTGYFRHLLTNSLPIRNFIDSDFAIINSDLGRHYGIPGKVDTSSRFQKVALTGSNHRGGLLGQIAVLTASANGVDTSPVTRGIWILENLLGTHPDPPPANVDVPEPDARGNLTIREIYAKHRTVESCRNCHKKIDPLGFSLENFDAVGAWRTDYVGGNPVDSTGHLPNGESFEGINGLKQVLLKDLDRFTRNLTAKLLTKATGRTMTTTDRPEIDRIVRELKESQGGLRDLMQLVITSKIFLTK